MPENQDRSFQHHRSETFGKVIALIDGRIKGIPPSILLRFDEIDMESMRHSAERESWSLLLRGIRHLHNGAPGGQPGSMTEALARASLRSCGLAAALSVKPPRFEQLYFSVDYATGHEAALFHCRRLAEAARSDIYKSKQIIHRKIMEGITDGAFGEGAGREDLAALKKQLAFSFNMLTDIYAGVCRDFMEELDRVTPPPPKPSGGPSP